MSMFEDMDGIGAYKKGFGTRVRMGANDRKVGSIGILSSYPCCTRILEHLMKQMSSQKVLFNDLDLHGIAT